MLSTIINQLQNKNILLLGYGREGQSSYHFIRKHIPQAHIGIADQNTQIHTLLQADDNISLHLGDNYLDAISLYDIVLQSPGISLKHLLNDIDISKISSQTDLFLQAFHARCIGVTGTKGKSTTSGLIYHLLHQCNDNVVFGGNIGLPLFELTDKIDPHTRIVLELSSHQLEFIHRGPHIGLLLNLYEEHLDHYNSYEDYQKAKYNIALKQGKEDYFIYSLHDARIQDRIAGQAYTSHGMPFAHGYDNKAMSYYAQGQFYLRTLQGTQTIAAVTDNFPLKGEHNYTNVSAALAAISCLQDTNWALIASALQSFTPLSHRLEPAGTYHDIIFYNDSISTIPQATIAAVEALQNVDTIILGGMDRGIDYTPLAEYMAKAKVRNFIFTGIAGKRMMTLFEQKHIPNLHFCSTYDEIVPLAISITRKGSICLLSPAASSYDSFKNFEHRGNYFKELIKK